MKTLTQIRKSEANAIDTDRMIVTTYYENSKKLTIMRVIRSKHAHTAVPNVIKHMQRDDYNAMVAEVWDERINEVLITINGSIGTAGMNITYFYDPVTGEKLRPQPHARKVSETVFQDRMAKVLEQLSADITPANVDRAISKIVTLREQVQE